MFSRPKNLMFEFKKESRLGTIIHTFFVFFPIEVIWLNSKMEVVDFKKVKPFRIAIPKQPAKYIIELAKKQP